MYKQKTTLYILTFINKKGLNGMKHMLTWLNKSKKAVEDMILKFQIDESTVQAAWLKTLYDLIEELNCKCNTYLEESKLSSYKPFSRKRIVEIYGSNTMVSWLKLRMERYTHQQETLNSKPEMMVFDDDNEDE